MEKKLKSKTCEFCHSTEGLPHPIGNFNVQLKQIDVYGIQKLACQSCFRKTKKNLKSKEIKTRSNPMVNQLKKILYKLASAFIFAILLSISLYAQGPPGLPGFPDNPDPAPIVGGLSLLAAAGGAYAIKKLRDKKKIEEEIE